MWKEDEWPPVLRRRGSEGSEVDARKGGGVLAQLLERVRPQERRGKERRAAARECESDAEDGRSSSRERAAAKASRRRADAVERVIDRAAAAFDASAVPERPKSACESTLLRAAEKLYSAAAAARPAAAVIRGGRTRSAEREAAGVRLPKSVPPPRVPAGGRGELFLEEVRAIVHAEPHHRVDVAFCAATVPRKAAARKENIYENFPLPQEARTLQREVRARPAFRKQSSLDALPSEGRGRAGHRKGEPAGVGGAEGRRGTPLRKADSFEGHEEAVRTLVAAVQENRIRRKKTK